MADERTELHTETDSARAGSTPHVVRWILGISLLAAIVLLSLIWITGAATRGPGSQHVEYNQQAQGSSTDSMVGENADQMETANPAVDETAAIPVVENEPEPAPSPTPKTGE